MLGAYSSADGGSLSLSLGRTEQTLRTNRPNRDRHFNDIACTGAGRDECTCADRCCFQNPHSDDYFECSIPNANVDVHTNDIQCPIVRPYTDHRTGHVGRIVIPSNINQRASQLTGSSPSRNVITSPASSVTQTSTQALIGLPSSSVVQSPSQALTSTPAASISILPQVQTRTSTLTATSLFSQSSLTSSTPEGSKGRLLRRHRRHVARGIEWPGPLVIGVSQAGTSTGQIGERSQPTADRPRRPVEGSQVQVSGDFAQGSDRGRSIFESLGENPAKRELVRSGTRRARMGQVLEFNGHGPFKKSRADLEDDSGHTSQELHRLGGWLKHGVKAD